MVSLDDLAARHEQHIDKVNALKAWVVGTFNPVKSKLAKTLEGAEKTKLQIEMKSLLAEYVDRRQSLVKDEGRFIHFAP